MDVKNAIQERRAYRSLDPVEITDGLVRDLAENARLAPSCFNNQPWRYVFAYDPEVLRSSVRLCRRGMNGRITPP